MCGAATPRGDGALGPIVCRTMIDAAPKSAERPAVTCGLDTFVRLRWLALTGQSAAVVAHQFGLG